MEFLAFGFTMDPDPDHLLWGVNQKIEDLALALCPFPSVLLCLPNSIFNIKDKYE